MSDIVNVSVWILAGVSLASFITGMLFSLIFVAAWNKLLGK